MFVYPGDAACERLRRNRWCEVARAHTPANRRTHVGSGGPRLMKRVRLLCRKVCVRATGFFLHLFRCGEVTEQRRGASVCITTLPPGVCCRPMCISSRPRGMASRGNTCNTRRTLPKFPQNLSHEHGPGTRLKTVFRRAPASNNGPFVAQNLVPMVPRPEVGCVNGSEWHA